jgi:hypothetical protein
MTIISLDTTNHFVIKIQMVSVFYEVRSKSLGIVYKAQKNSLKWRSTPCVRQSVCDFISMPQTFERFISNMTVQIVSNLSHNSQAQPYLSTKEPTLRDITNDLRL